MMRKRILEIVFLLLFVCGMVLPAQAAGDADHSETGLPVIRLTIDPQEWDLVLSSKDHSYRAKAGSIEIEVPEGFAGEFSDDPLESTQELPLAYIRGRGNSTWFGVKKPFKFKLEESADLLGMGENKHWVLLANAFDGSLLRNSLMSYAGREIGLEYTPKMVPV